ncbi:MAG: hypothetical protein KAJ10_09190, partial [Thermodesulfovibrionia bacterium]|nr:hypothetical protein [Thermodesulfovibrionia bacterium]
QAFWAYEGSHVLFRDAKDVYLIEIETYGEFKLDHIFEVKDKSSIFYSDDTGEMYFLDSGTGELLATRIVPGEGAIPLILPETKKKKKRNKIEEL